MSWLTTRAALLQASSLPLVLAMGVTGASASTVVAGGSTLAAPAYGKIFADVGLNTPPYTCTASVDVCYVSIGSGPGTTGFLNNDSTQLGLAAGIPVDFAGGDAVLSTTQISAFQTAHGYQLIQIPAFGTPMTIPFNYPGKTKNAAIKLTDADLCGIFSGKVQDWSGTSATGLSGPIAVVYRQDSGFTSFLLTNHLGAVCTTSNATASFVNALAANKAAANRTGNDGGTNKFATLFPGYTTSADGKSFFVPAGTFANAVAASGSSGTQQALVATAKSVGYVGPDYTAIAAVPTLATGVTKAPFVASVNNSLPNTVNTTAALASFTFTPVATNPDSFGVLVPVPNAVPGKFPYPIVGYATLLLSSKYSSTAKVGIVKTFLAGVYNQSGTCSQCVTDLTQSGFVPVPGVTATAAPKKLGGQIVKAYLATNATVKIVAGTGGR